MPLVHFPLPAAARQTAAAALRTARLPFTGRARAAGDETIASTCAHWAAYISLSLPMGTEHDVCAGRWLVYS